jgi:hypothetical protein
MRLFNNHFPLRDQTYTRFTIWMLRLDYNLVNTFHADYSTIDINVDVVALILSIEEVELHYEYLVP